MDIEILNEVVSSSPVAGAMIFIAWMIVKRLDKIERAIGRIHERIDRAINGKH